MVRSTIQPVNQRCKRTGSPNGSTRDGEDSFPVCPIAWKTLFPFQKDDMTPERDDLAVISYSAQDMLYNIGISEGISVGEKRLRSVRRFIPQEALVSSRFKRVSNGRDGAGEADGHSRIIHA